MAIYHYSVQVISRGTGRSAVAAAAYRAGQAIEDERTGLVHDYTSKEGVAHSEILLPENAPEWMNDRARLWNHAESVENRKNSQIAREINLALPIELTREQQIKLTQDFAKDQFTDRGMIADINVHLDHSDNPHAHIMLTLREVNRDGLGAKNRNWNRRDLLRSQRQTWEEYANRALAREGHEAQIDHRTLEAQGIDREPTIHLGRAVMEMEEKGIETERGALYRKIVDLNVYREVKKRRETLAENSIETLLSKQSTFTERDLYRTVSKKANELLGTEEIRETVLLGIKDKSVVVGKDQQRMTRYSTKEMIELERGMIVNVKSRVGEDRHGLSDKTIEHILSSHSLSPEQKNALRHITRPGGVQSVEGMAGTGKSHLMGAAREVWESEGYEVRGAALSGKAAQSLSKESGIPSQTIHSLIIEIENGRTNLGPKTVLVVDEAGMVDNRLMAKVLDEAKSAKTKVILVGDAKQLQAIGPGGAFRAITDEIGSATLKDIRRQKDNWARESVHEFSRGEAKSALLRIQEKGSLKISNTKEEAIQSLVQDWNADQRNVSQKIMLAGTRAEVKQLNEYAREKMKEAELLGPSERIKTERGMREIGEGDRILFLRNNRELEVKNGTVGTVERVQYDGNWLTIKTDENKTVSFDPKKYPHLEHGYATTVHKAQGVTVDKAYVLAGRMHDRELSYVSMSRAREKTTLYADKSRLKQGKEIEGLAKSMEKSHQKKTTLDYSEIRIDKEKRVRMEKDRDRVGEGLNKGKATYKEVQINNEKEVEGIYRGVTKIDGEKYAIVETNRSFELVPHNTELRKHLHKEVKISRSGPVMSIQRISRGLIRDRKSRRER